MSSEYAVAEAIVTGYAARGGAPGIAYGIVRDGELAHWGGVGARRLGGPAPDADTVFRIASMTKSFTASAVLLLRDSGLIALDDPAEEYVPELAGWAGVPGGTGGRPPGLAESGGTGGRPPGLAESDAARVSIRHLLAMTAGFPTDDPWGDRQQGLPLAELAGLLAGGVSASWAPGTRFEYSNLGYAILGMVITAASGVPYADFIRARLLEPLGMSRTGYEAAEFAADVLAPGYRRGAGGWQEVPYDPHGAFAPMGGIFSCVRDLATWVTGFADTFPPGAGTSPHPLRAASRREMQLPQAVIPPARGYSLPGSPLGGPGAYGFGLFVDEEPGSGRVVSHSGGYPGFGSNMRWHPATGTGVIALGNGTYAPMSLLTALILDALISRRPAGRQVPMAPVPGGSPRAQELRAGGPWPETLAAREAITTLLTTASGSEADDAALFSKALFSRTRPTSALSTSALSTAALSPAALFTPNVALDRPYPERIRDIALLRSRIGAFKDAGRAVEHDTPAHCRWFLAGEHGPVVQVQIQLSPERPPRVQSLTLAIPPARDSPLARTLDAVIAWLNSGSASWPESVPVTPGTDASLLARRLRMAAAWTGAVTPGAFRAGDGAASVSVELSGEHAPAVLALLADPSTGALRAADATL